VQSRPVGRELEGIEIREGPVDRLHAQRDREETARA
jgi:hypothetical protein